MRLSAHVGPWAPGGSVRAEGAPMAGGGGSDLRPGQEKLPAAQAGSGDAPWDRGRSQSRLTGMMPLWTTQHGFHGASQSEGASWSGSSRKADLGYFPTGSTPLG